MANLHPSLARVLEKSIKMEISSRYLTAEAMRQDLYLSEFQTVVVVPPTGDKNIKTSGINFEKNNPPIPIVEPSLTQPIYTEPKITDLSNNSQKQNDKSSLNIVVILLLVLVALFGSLAVFFVIHNINQTQQKIAKIEQEKEEIKSQLSEDTTNQEKQELEALKQEVEQQRLEAERLYQQAQREKQQAQQEEKQNESNQQVSQSTSDLDQSEALDLVYRWYQAKPEIFGGNFNTYFVEELTTGELYYNTTKYDGSVNWLINNGCYYVYDYSNIDSIISFNNQTSRPSLTVQVSERLALNGSSSAGCNGKYNTYSKPVTYWFEKENGQWKIYNYKVHEQK